MKTIAAFICFGLFLGMVVGMKMLDDTSSPEAYHFTITPSAHGDASVTLQPAAFSTGSCASGACGTAQPIVVAYNPEEGTAGCSDCAGEAAPPVVAAEDGCAGCAEDSGAEVIVAQDACEGCAGEAATPVVAAEAGCEGCAETAVVASASGDLPAMQEPWFQDVLDSLYGDLNHFEPFDFADGLELCDDKVEALFDMHQAFIGQADPLYEHAAQLDDLLARTVCEETTPAEAMRWMAQRLAVAGELIALETEFRMAVFRLLGPEKRRAVGLCIWGTAPDTVGACQDCATGSCSGECGEHAVVTTPASATQCEDCTGHETVAAPATGCAGECGDCTGECEGAGTAASHCEGECDDCTGECDDCDGDCEGAGTAASHCEGECEDCTGECDDCDGDCEDCTGHETVAAAATGCAGECGDCTGECEDCTGDCDDCDDRESVPATDPAPEETLLRAMQAYQAGNFPVAEECCAALLSADPAQPMVWFNLALIRAASGHPEAAVDALLQAASHGFADWDRVRGNARLAPLCTNPRLTPHLPSDARAVSTDE